MRVDVVLESVVLYTDVRLPLRTGVVYLDIYVGFVCIRLPIGLSHKYRIRSVFDAM